MSVHDGISRPLSPIATACGLFFEDVAPGSEKYVYFWISIPVGQWAGAYTNTIFVKAVKGGNTP